jgi:hypothetical protein
MASFRARTRFASLVAIGLVLLLSGVVAGAAGGNFILGQANSAGTANTSLTTSSTGNALLVTQNGTGTAIRGSTGTGAGIAGFFTSGSGSGVSGVVGAENSYGVYAANDSANEGSGAAMRVNGKQNEGIIATSDDTNALRGVVTGCDGAFLCGGNGVAGTGYGFAAGAYGDGTDALAGLWASEGALAAVYATQSVTDIPAVYASSTDGTGVEGRGLNGTGDMSDLPEAGGAFNGSYGVIGQTDIGLGAGVYARTTAALSYALFADGESYIDGNLTVSGTCTGCAAAITGINGSATTLKQGDAVALDGVTQAKDGSIVLVVRAANKGDAVIGVVDRELTTAPDSIKVGGDKRTIKQNRAGDKEVTSPSRTIEALKGLWGQGGTSVAADKYLRIITGGFFAYDGAAPAGAAVGDLLSVNASTGKLAKAAVDAAVGAKAGRYLGTLKDGRIVVFVDPS